MFIKRGVHNLVNGCLGGHVANAEMYRWGVLQDVEVPQKVVTKRSASVRYDIRSGSFTRYSAYISDAPFA